MEESKCKACRELFLSDTDDDLCPECFDAMSDGTTTILLGKKETAIVFRDDGNTELYLPDLIDNATDLQLLQEIIASFIYSQLKNPTFVKECIKVVEEEFKKEQLQ